MCQTVKITQMLALNTVDTSIKFNVIESKHYIHSFLNEDQNVSKFQIIMNSNLAFRSIKFNVIGFK